MRVLLSPLFLIIAFHIQAQSVDQLDWIVGNWESSSNGLVFNETWSRSNDSTLTGISTIRKGGIEKFAEKLKIEIVNGQISYVAVLPQKTAFFPLHKLDSSSVSFLDPNNNFPSRIIYVQTAEGMVITLEGSDSENPQVEKLNFIKK